MRRPPMVRVNGYVKPGPQQGVNGPILITPASGTSTTWVLTIIVGAACIGAMCKSGNRTHLD